MSLLTCKLNLNEQQGETIFWQAVSVTIEHNRKQRGHLIMNNEEPEPTSVKGSKRVKRQFASLLGSVPTEVGLSRQSHEKVLNSSENSVLSWMHHIYNCFYYC